MKYLGSVKFAIALRKALPGIPLQTFQIMQDHVSRLPTNRRPVLNIRHLVPLLFSLLLLHPVFSQEDFSWWNQKHDWDGITNWQYYLIPSPGYFGPNALPVPELFDGKMDTSYLVELAWDRHFRKTNRDDTHNLWVRAFFPLFSDRVGVNLEIVPLEWYRTDTLVRDERRSRQRNPRGTASGDLNVALFIQLLKEKGWRPDLMLRINLRTASGNNLGGARFLDSPGYYFDLTAGKSFALKNRLLQQLRPYLMGGFYVYQSNYLSQDQRQNDCILFGAGLDLTFRHMLLQNQITGYSGYLGDRDQVTVYRISLESRFDFPLNARLRFQTGLQNWGYRTVRISTVLTFAR